MDLKEIKELMSAMGRARMNKLKLKTDSFEIELQREVPRNGEQQAPILVHSQPIAQAPLAAQAPAPLPVQSEQGLKHEAPQQEAPKPGKFVTSPMVGTFYKASGPTSDPYVKVGDTVSEDTVVCIIEAMKVMNEVKAGVSGVVKEILVNDGDTLEFGSNILRVE